MAIIVLLGIWCGSTRPWAAAASAVPRGSCFILYQAGFGEVRRSPSTTCSSRVSPQSTFKIAHALAALDAGVLEGAEARLAYDGRPVDWPSWRQDHTLATAMRDSVVWYFQEVARRLGPTREHEYLTRFDYGNRDSSSGLTTFWLGGSLAISPEEQVAFLRKLFDGRLAVNENARETVVRILQQPFGAITNASGEHPFGGRWPDGTVLNAKTGSGPDGHGGAVRWLVGQVRRGSSSWIFVSNVVGDPDTPALAAVDLAETALRASHILLPAR
jgi:beta-lactamase class D